MIYLKDIDNYKLRSFDTLDASIAFSENYEYPENLFRIYPIYCDGAGTNGRKSGYSWGRAGDIKIKYSSDTLTNNEAEYLGIIMASIVCDCHDIILTDSLLVTNQVTGLWQIKTDRLRALCRLAKDLKTIKHLSIAWIPRNLNFAGKALEKCKSLKNSTLINSVGEPPLR